jgi:peroxiredoxin
LFVASHPVQEVTQLKILKYSVTVATIAVSIMTIAGAATLVVGASETQKASIDKPAPNFTLVDISGKKHSLADYKGKYVVLEWNNWDCPFVKKHYSKGNMQQLQKTYGKKEVVWLTICSSGPGKQGYYEADAQKEKVAKSKSEATAYLIDSEGTVGKMYGAKTTPHMFVINPDGVLMYAGAIDDKPSTKTSDIEAANNYIQSCLEAALAGKDVETKTSTPYGCSVKYNN